MSSDKNMFVRLVDIGGIVDHHCLRKVRRYQRYNQKPYRQYKDQLDKQ